MLEKYKFRKYSEKYLKLFEQEKERLMKILPNSAIEHIGSTSIVGLGGKAVIDILIYVNKNQINSCYKKLIGNGYFFRKSGSGKNRIFFEKEYGILFKNWFHIHLTSSKNVMRKALFFRNLLRKNRKLFNKYLDLKKEAIKRNLKGKDYRNIKNKFVSSVLKNGRT